MWQRAYSSHMKPTTQRYPSVSWAAVVNTGRGAVGKRRNQAVILATLSLKFSSKASWWGGGGGLSEKSAEMLDYIAGDNVWSRQVDVWLTSTERVIEVSCSFKYCEMWSKNLSLSLSSICDSLQQMSTTIRFYFPVYVFACLAWSPSPCHTSLILRTSPLWSSLPHQSLSRWDLTFTHLLCQTYLSPGIHDGKPPRNSFSMQGCFSSSSPASAHLA